MGRISRTALLLFSSFLQFASAGVDVAGTGEARGTITTVLQPPSACPDDGTSERDIHGASNETQLGAAKAAKKAARSVQKSETRTDCTSTIEESRILLAKGANQGDPIDASVKKETPWMAASSGAESVPLKRATATSACPEKRPPRDKGVKCPGVPAMSREIVELYQKSCSHGLLVPVVSKMVDLRSAGAAVLRRRMILLQDLSDAVLGLILIYRILGGTDMNVIRRDHHAACRLLEEAKITHSALWNEQAEQALAYGRKVGKYLRNRVVSGVLKPFPSVSQLTKTGRRDRLVAASQQVDAAVNAHVLPAYTLQLTTDDDSLERKREIVKKINTAIHTVASTRAHMSDVWYLYAEFLYMWLKIKQVNMQGEVQGEEEARTQTTSV